MQGCAIKIGYRGLIDQTSLGEHCDAIAQRERAIGVVGGQNYRPGRDSVALHKRGQEI